MKKLYILGISLMAIGAVNAQTLFSSDFSSWTAGSLTDMGGAKTSIDAASVTQVSSGAMYGTDLVQLENATSSHKRFSTFALAVDLDSTYIVEIYAKGQGDVRMGLFDGDLDGQDYGYQYGAYISINSTSTAMYTQSFNSDTTTTAAEFLISLRNTVATDHIQIDSMIVKKGAYVAPAPPTLKSIYEIQSNTTDGDLSYYEDSVVNTGGIVTALNILNGVRKGYYIQAGSGAYSGIYVFDGSSVLEVGDSITLSGTVDEYYNATQLGFVSDVTIISNFNDVDVTVLTTAGVANEMYESVLCQVVNANCTALPDTYGEWTVNDGSTALLIGDFLFPYTPTVGTSYNVTGVTAYAFSAWKIYPRDGNDISVYTSVKENNSVLTNVYPNPTTSGLVNVEVTENTALVVMDLLGNVVLSESLTSTLNSVDVSTLAAGNYILKVGSSVQQLMVK